MQQRNLVGIKVQKYSVEQRKCLDTNIGQLVRLGYLRPNPYALWQAATHPVDEECIISKATLYPKQDNAATIGEVWPIPNQKAELADLAGYTCFATTDFCGAYCQIALEKKSYNARRTILAQGIFTST